MDAMDLTGRVALVTGGSRGIGAAIAKALAQHGAAIGVNYLSNRAAADETVTSIKATGGRAMPVGGDVSVEADVRRITAEVTDALGPVDILIANAGITRRQDMDEITEQDFNEIMQANLTSAFLCAQAVVSGMRERGWGRLIFVGSGAAHNGGRVGLHYSAAKGGMEALARAYARPLAGEGVTSNCVVPTLIETDMTSDASEKALVFSPPVGRSGHVDEVAMAAVMLAANGYMTGQTVHMNGGLYFS